MEKSFLFYIRNLGICRFWHPGGGGRKESWNKSPTDDEGLIYA
jgi:hypothetical protein